MVYMYSWLLYRFKKRPRLTGNNKKNKDAALLSLQYRPSSLPFLFNIKFSSSLKYLFYSSYLN